MHAECDPNDLEHCCGDCLYEIAKAQRIEIKQLQAIVDRLPKTKDGVPVVPGMVLYLRWAGRYMSQLTVALRDKGLHASYYSTRTAAEKP